MSYMRRPMGQDEPEGPITHPSQVDDTIIVGEVAPKRVPCDQLPADSPWRQPGQVCAPSRSLLEIIRDAFGTGTNGATAVAPSPPVESPASPLLLLGAAAGLYYLLRSRKKRA